MIRSSWPDTLHISTILMKIKREIEREVKIKLHIIKIVNYHWCLGFTYHQVTHHQDLQVHWNLQLAQAIEETNPNQRGHCRHFHH